MHSRFIFIRLLLHKQRKMIQSNQMAQSNYYIGHPQDMIKWSRINKRMLVTATAADALAMIGNMTISGMGTYQTNSYNSHNNDKCTVIKARAGISMSNYIRIPLESLFNALSAKMPSPCSHTDSNHN